MGLNPEIAAVLGGEADGCIITGDCLEIMADMPDGCVDAVVTDPPYGIGFKYESHRDTPEGYGEWIWSICERAEMQLCPGSPMFVWQAMRNIRRLAEWFPRDWRIFAAAKNFVQMRPCAMQYSWDPVLVWWTDGEQWSAGTASRDFHVGNTANTMNRKDGDSCGHPCARPLDQMEHILRQWVRPGGVILDPFCGSGTTCVAAKKLGRRWIGIEIDPGYAETARRRVASTPKPLFVEEPKPAAAAGLFEEMT